MRRSQTGPRYPRAARRARAGQATGNKTTGDDGVKDPINKKTPKNPLQLLLISYYCCDTLYCAVLYSVLLTEFYNKFTPKFSRGTGRVTGSHIHCIPLRCIAYHCIASHRATLRCIALHCVEYYRATTAVHSINSCSFSQPPQKKKKKQENVKKEAKKTNKKNAATRVFSTCRFFCIHKSRSSSRKTTFLLLVGTLKRGLWKASTLHDIGTIRTFPLVPYTHPLQPGGRFPIKMFQRLGRRFLVSHDRPNSPSGSVSSLRYTHKRKKKLQTCLCQGPCTRMTL